jgi:hypothetical protein
VARPASVVELKEGYEVVEFVRFVTIWRRRKQARVHSRRGVSKEPAVLRANLVSLMQISGGREVVDYATNVCKMLEV